VSPSAISAARDPEEPNAASETRAVVLEEQQLVTTDEHDECRRDIDRVEEVVAAVPNVVRQDPDRPMITSPSNPRLKLVRRLASRRQREKERLFVCEGEDLLDAAREQGIEPADVLVAGEDVDPKLLADVSTLAHPPRVIAVFRRDDLPAPDLAVPALALWRVADPGNVGTLIRAADAFGASVALSAGCADPTAPKGLRASAGAIFRVGVGRFDHAPRPWVALDARAPTPLAELELAEPLTFVVGAEREGLPDDVVARSDERARIPQRPSAESLNVAMAGTIALYELSRRRARAVSARSAP
jgi:TrmH family RNA methyltransferase